MKNLNVNDTTVSVSTGCFVFKKSEKRRKRVKAAPKDDYLYSDLWYLSYKETWKKTENILKDLRCQSFEKVLENLISYVSVCYKGPEMKFQENVVPIAGLLTGINLPDHAALFDSLKAQLHKDVTPHVAVLPSRECRTVRVAVEKMVSQFMSRKVREKEPEDDPLTDEESESDVEQAPQKVKKSQCNFPVLLEWYKAVKAENFFAVKSSAVKNKRKKDNQEYQEPLVVVIPNFENFSHRVLKDFILISSAYVPTLPIVIILGVATSSLAISRCLPYNVSSRVRIKLFQITPSTTTLNNIIEQVLFSKNIMFRLGSKAFKFLVDNFLFYDFSVQGFIQGYKICMMEHYADRDWFSMCCSPKKLDTRLSSLTAEDLEYLRRLPSLRAYVESLPPKQRAPVLLDDSHFKEVIKKLLQELRSHLGNYHVALRCLYCFTSSLPSFPLGKTLRELYSLSVSQPVIESTAFRHCFQLLHVQSQEELSTLIESALDSLSKHKQYYEEDWGPKLDHLHTTLKHAALDLQHIADFGTPVKKRESTDRGSPSKRSPLKRNNFDTPIKTRNIKNSPLSTPVKESVIDSPVRRNGLISPTFATPTKKSVRISPAKRSKLLESPEVSPSKRAINTLGGNMSRNELKKRLLELKEQQCNEDEDLMSRFETTRHNLLTYLSEEAFPTLLQPPTSLALAEVMFFDDVARIKSRIVGAPRGAIHAALSNPSSYLECECCRIPEPGAILPTMPDICIAFKLHLESGRFISLADWLQAFAAVINPSENSDDDDDDDDDDDGDDDDNNKAQIDPHIQARFTQAVNELQFLGFIRATRRKMDHVARLTWDGC